ncbi:MAG: DUF2927 domain-containing protein [Maritimibacter sp.]
MRLFIFLFGLALGAGSAGAQEFVQTEGALSDEAFYRLVSCAAPPKEDCQKPSVRWDVSHPVRVSIRQMDAAYLGGKKIRATAALARALQELNRAEVGLTLVEVPAGDTAEIELFFLDLERGEPIAGTGIKGVDGSRLGGASTRILFDANTNTIKRVAVVFSTTLQIRAYESVMLEELSQALGLMTDIRNPYYDERSIFSQDSNARKTLGAQDILALRHHYAKD